ncbi:DUF1294 domain-containing protein [Paenibacillus sp. IB182496]|uniref:DUF1294 domain-containing protein n=1 Tax=Paenibacillus sabuli TaxID=2772509 RepID=A0A927BXH2_9BACL|nr:DUF1294 domain-containing protein [Paenibacillus sabuli]MBD2847239.1 DUF1294 domain-containing protein [Paenibacillus sabuli]
MTGIWLAVGYLIVINAVACGMMRADKQRARQHRRRIPEKRLLLAAAVGGAAGAWLGMRRWRHKTKHAAFAAGLPLMTLAQAALLIWLAMRLLRLI